MQQAKGKPTALFRHALM